MCLDRVQNRYYTIALQISTSVWIFFDSVYDNASFAYYPTAYMCLQIFLLHFLL